MCADARELSEYKHLANPVVVGAVVDRLPTIELREWDVYRFGDEAAARNFTSELRCLEEFIARQLPGVRRLADRQRAVKAAGLSSGSAGKQGGGDKKNHEHFENQKNVERKNHKAKEMFRVISSAAQAAKPNSPNKPSKPQSSGSPKVQANAGGGGGGDRPSAVVPDKCKGRKCSEKGFHMLNRCPDFRAKPLDEKWDLVLSEDLCWVCLRGRHADGQTCFLAQWLANNKKQPCGFMGCNEDHSLALHPPPQRALVNMLWVNRPECRSHGHDLEVAAESEEGIREGEECFGLDMLFGDPSAPVDAEKEKTGDARTSTDHDLDLEPRHDQDTDEDDWINDKPPRSLLHDVLHVLGDRFKLESGVLGHQVGADSLQRGVTMTAERTMVEGVPANVQYDTGAEVCLITERMVSQLGLSRMGEPCWMELTSALGGPPVICTRRHRLHFKTGPFLVATVLVYQVDNIGELPAAYDVQAADQLFPQAGRADLRANWGFTSGAVDVLLGINAVHLHPREEELRGGVRLLQSSVSGNYLLTGTMVTGPAVAPANPPLPQRSLNIAPAANVASMPARPAATRVVPADVPTAASAGARPQRRSAPAVTAASARQNFGPLRVRSSSRAGAKTLQNKASSRAKAGPVKGTGFRGGPSGPSRFALSRAPVWTGGAGRRAVLRRQNNDNDNDWVTIRLRTSWSLTALFLMAAILLGMNVPRVSGFTAYDCSNRSNNVEVYSLLEPASCHSASLDLRVERIMPAEIIQVKKTRVVPVLRCLAVVTEVSQYCGHSSAAGVMRFHRFRETAVVEPASCREAFEKKGQIELAGKSYKAVIGQTTSHQDYVAGGLDEANHCEAGTFRDSITKKSYGYQTGQRITEITLFREQGIVNDVLGTIRLSDNIMTKAADESVKDTMRGTYIWRHEKLACPDTISQIYRGPMRFYMNGTDTNLEGGLAVLEKDDQIAGLELTNSFSLCHAAAWATHLKDIVVVLHSDNYTSVAKSGFDPGAVSETTSLESQLSFLHIKNALSQKEILRQVKLAICENRRQLLLSRLEAVAGTDNPYSLTNVLSRGILLTRAGSVVYATTCFPVQVNPRGINSGNCSHEIPAVYNETEVFVDPINWVIKPIGTTVHCSDVAPPRFLIAGNWYCQYKGLLMECHEPALLPITPLGIGEPTLKLGLGRSIYTDNQMKEFYAFQNAAGARNAYLADQTERAFQTMNNGEWGLALGDRAREMMLDHVGWSFIPLYRLFGPLSMLFILLIFVVGLVRLGITLVVRTVVIVRARGCGVWVLAAFWGTLYQLLITPIRWADKTAEEMARNVGKQMEDEAEQSFLYPLKQLRNQEDSDKPLWNLASGLFRKERPNAPVEAEALKPV